ncbi:unnamed protein product [Orchesella dallaii]|uniref:Uncharacterized protein n=1 Tax=Orchesella dallaii TaxID=48710 RepID=A0ABP1RXU8_9HEXA
MKYFGILVISILALSLSSLCLGKVVTKPSLHAPTNQKAKESFLNQLSKQKYGDEKDKLAKTGNSIEYYTDLQKKLDYTISSSEEHHMDVKHGVFNGNSPIVIGSEEDSDETYVRGLRQAGAMQEEKTCLHDLEPCRRHKQCCGGYCNWGIGLKCLGQKK